MAEATVGKALHYLSQHTELDAKNRKELLAKKKQIDSTSPGDGRK